MKYQIGDIIKTIDYDKDEKTVYINYHNKIGIILEEHFPNRPNPLYKILLCGTNNRTVWINEDEIAGKLE